MHSYPRKKGFPSWASRSITQPWWNIIGRACIDNFGTDIGDASCRKLVGGAAEEYRRCSTLLLPKFAIMTASFQDCFVICVAVKSDPSKTYVSAKSILGGLSRFLPVATWNLNKTLNWLWLYSIRHHAMAVTAIIHKSELNAFAQILAPFGLNPKQFSKKHQTLNQIWQHVY
ncbi:hypothetical protein AMATHDRAFT_68780 [Amanita thiersii Skay4041]|uniref:Uncharacterized protein n=1 Tax=Amanita thiersii Skay4041 TaxID=703135 RepID=A0A2A9NA13_9AGAR|nr:hypothetical protein AMATHDRAFT_68780 [Amanita thiersii Skay4041]